MIWVSLAANMQHGIIGSKRLFYDWKSFNFHKNEVIMVEGWHKVYKSPHEFEAAIIKELLEDHGLHPVILNQKDSEFLLGDVGVFVAPEEAENALKVIESNQTA